MKFKEIYDKYINGVATEEEIKFIEEEIEKNEIINEYLSKEIDEELFNKKELFGDIDFINDTNDMTINKESEKDLLKSINKTIRMKLLKTGACSVLVVIGLLLSSKYMLSPLINSKYYSPNEKVGQYTEKLLSDFAIFTELHFPGIITSYANSEELGYGKYNIKISQSNTFKNNEITYEGTIDKGELNYIEDGFYQYPAMEIFKYGVYPYDTHEYSDDMELEELKSLLNTAKSNVYVSFKEDVDINEITNLIKKYDDLYFSWVGVRTCDKETQQLPQMGFETSGTGIIIEGFEGSEKYPYIELGGVEGKISSTEVYEAHFKSLLNYMIDNKEFTELNHPNVYDDVYKDTLEYVNKNGIKSYGVLVQGDAESILKLKEESYVYGIRIDDVKISSYSH